MQRANPRARSGLGNCPYAVSGVRYLIVTDTLLASSRSAILDTSVSWARRRDLLLLPYYQGRPTFGSGIGQRPQFLDTGIAHSYIHPEPYVQRGVDRVVGAVQDGREGGNCLASCIMVGYRQCV